ncbi:MAG: hypothetical protein SFU56_03080 [Capsulimonadales bacterium]|nr:hypothetical protein [Capsulimonadales bacterium]
MHYIVSRSLRVVVVSGGTGRTGDEKVGNMVVRRLARLLIMVFLAFSAVVPAAAAEPLVTLRTGMATFLLDGKGGLQGILRRDSGTDYLASAQTSALLRLRVAGQWYTPNRAEWDGRRRRLTLHYPQDGLVATLLIEAKRTHIVLEIANLRSPEPVEIALWGPYPTTIRSIIGETVGVVRDDEFAIGIQALNPKTLGGYPSSENDIEQEPSGDDLGNYPDLDPELLKGQHYRGDTALRTPFGSTLQAYCRNRDRERIVPNWNHERYVVKPFADGGPIGSKIALFACPAKMALATLGAIEVAENLPHPTLNGVWAKRSREATASYLIIDFGEETIDRALEMTRRAGLKYLYHSSPFDTWGQFRLKPRLFPSGWTGLRDCVEKARKAGISVGLHTLSNFITTNDPYVTPKPDPRLAAVGSSPLTAPIDAKAREIPIASPEAFLRKGALNTVVIGDELIRYGSVTDRPPYRLLDCARGAWGTTATAHTEQTPVRKLLDHEYKVFLSDASLSLEIARNIADVLNRTGCIQMSFDGLEGNWSTGYGQYGRTLFTKAWYDALSPELQGKVINDASNPGHFNWHINTRMNWGEPWYAGFRESQTLYRFKNQVYFERNLMPRMLGWFSLRPDTSVEDVEWLLARAAGFDAGFALATSLASTAQLDAAPDSVEAARLFGATGEILETVRQWETARMAGAFPASVRAALRDNRREFQLRPRTAGAWELREARYHRFSFEGDRERTPADFGKFVFDNPDAFQEVAWTIRSTAKEPVRGLTLTIDGAKVVDLGDRPLPPDGILKYRGGEEAVITDGAWREIERIPVVRRAARVSFGTHNGSLRISAPMSGVLKIELRTLGTPTRLQARKRP